MLLQSFWEPGFEVTTLIRTVPPHGIDVMGDHFVLSDVAWLFGPKGAAFHPTCVPDGTDTVSLALYDVNLETRQSKGCVSV